MPPRFQPTALATALAALAASEAVVEAAGRCHGEAGGLLVVERAEPLQRSAARVAQGDVSADDILDPAALTDGRDVLVIDAACHG